MRFPFLALAAVLAALSHVVCSPVSDERSLVPRGTTKLDQACKSSDACQSGHFCNHGKCAQKASNGRACYKDNGCTSGLCYQTTCLAASSRPNAAPCSQSSQCSSGNCSRSKCTARVANGGACYKDANCVSGSCTSSRCRAKSASDLAIGRACSASTQCASGNCSRSKCAAKVADGGACYKAANCVSGTCGGNAKCASSPTPTSPPPTNAATPTVVNGGLDSLNGYAVAGNAAVTVANDASLGRDGSYAQAVVPPGGNFSLTQRFGASQRRSLVGRQNTLTYVTYIWRRAIAFSPPYEEGIHGGALTPVCRIYYTMNGIRTNGNTFTQADDWYREGGHTYDAVLSSFGADIECEAGASLTLLLDDFSYIYVPGYTATTPPNVSTPTGTGDADTTIGLDDGGSTQATTTM